MTKEEKKWAVWLFFFLGSFFYLETRALNSEDRVTLTAFTKKMLGVHPRKPWGAVGSLCFIGFCTWLATHMTTGGGIDERRSGEHPLIQNTHSTSS